MKVLMITGAYSPEISSGGLQSELMARRLRGMAEVRVLTTAVDPSIPSRSTIDGIAVTRIHVRIGHPWSQLVALSVMASALLRLVPWCDVIHVHGVSRKNVLVAAIAKLLGRPVIVSLHTMGADAPGPIRRLGAAAWWAFRSARRYLAVSPALLQASVDAGVPPDRIELVPNGIDTERFAPASAPERLELRRSAGFNAHDRIVLFVGFFSHDKQPRVLFDAWLQLRDRHGLATTACFVGAHKSSYAEVDENIGDGMRRDAAARAQSDALVLTGPVRDVERYFRLADVFVLPSRREGLPVALMEAMACGLPGVASHLAGATDVLIENGVSGSLVPAGDVGAFADALHDVFADAARAAAMGAAARKVIVERFASDAVARRWLSAYQQVTSNGRDTD